MKKIFVLLLIGLVLGGAGALAAEQDQSSVNSGGSRSTAAGFNNTASVGDIGVLSLSNSTYTGASGFQAGLTITSTGGGSSTVQINSVEFDGQSVIDNDYINPNPVITGIVTSSASIISPEVTRIIIDGAATAFSDFVIPNTYTASNGAFSFSLASSALSAGTHYVTIEAYDQNSNSDTYSRTVVVDTGEQKASAVYFFPNPYDPGTGPGKIAYTLTKSEDVSIYIFNIVGQLVFKDTFIAGGPGASAGYNEVEFSGTSVFGNNLPNDIYFLRIVSGGKPIGRTKIAILK